MDENKRMAKAFVDKYFPLKQQSTNSLSDALDKLGLPSNSSSPETSKSKKQGSAADISTSKSRDSLQKDSNPAAILWEVPESCLVGSAVGYGSRDYYFPNPPPSRSVGNYSYEGKDRKDGHDHKTSENPRNEWWQGSHNY